ncbi:molybdenum ABC transporter ATP-binding protein, partial [Escherichia coli]|nr:molybdenum ABC transporter ATP-binding protein [Escherichia coli]
IAGFEPVQGRIVFDGQVWQDGAQSLPPHRRGVGMVFQDTRLFPHLSVAGNLRYAARRAQGAIHQDDVIGALDLGPLLARRPGGLSGGERQRVAIGRALLAQPRLMLMDAPLAALDAARKAQILPLIARLPQVFGIPVIHVTHSIEEVTQIADRLIAMQDGRIVASGPLAETFARLDLGAGGSRFEGGVILRGRVSGGDARYHLTRLQVAGHELIMPEAGLHAGDEVQLRIRARDVMLATVRPEGLSAQNVLPCRITEIVSEAETAFAEVFLDVDGQVLRARVTRAAVDQMGLAVGGQVFAVLKAISFDRRLAA